MSSQNGCEQPRVVTAAHDFTETYGGAELVSLMRSCRALIFPSRDDFGLLPLEVMACGRPVLAYWGGGARHAVVAGVTGEFFDDQRATTIAGAVAAFDPDAYDPERIRAHALRWDRKEFRERIVRAVEALAG